jgi:hypothetical protein
MPDTFTKRQKSRDRQERQREKAAKRSQKRQEEAGRPPGTVVDGVDPDIAGIVPGPQPVLEE